MRMLYFYLLLTLFASCGKELFVGLPQNQTSQGDPIQYSSSQSCAGFTLVKPKVDFLFLVDNSSSTNFMNSDLKNSLKTLISQISTQFDYHAMVAPLIDNGQTDFPLLVYNTDGLSLSVLDRVKNIGQIDLFSMPQGSGNQEKGFLRAHTLVTQNIGNNIFRMGSNVIIVVISNGDDNDATTSGTGNNVITSMFDTRFAQLKKLSLAYHNSNPSDPDGQVLKAQQLRFISITPQTASCYPGDYNYYRHNYEKMSKQIYNYVSASDQSGDSTPDAYDLCVQSYGSVFTSINNSITQTLVAYTYKYWKIADSLTNIDTDQIQVFKGSTQLTKGDTNGFDLVSGYQTNLNTRELPTAGEPQSGYFIQLSGTGKVTYPDCLSIKTQTPATYYGYFVLGKEPDPSKVVVKINGQTIPAAVGTSPTSGWRYIGFQLSQNIKVKSRTDSSSQTPAVNQTGYVIKLYGSSIYSNNDTIEVILTN